MNIGTLTENDQITPPKTVQEYLWISPGDKLEFVISSDGYVVLKP